MCSVDLMLSTFRHALPVIRRSGGSRLQETFFLQDLRLFRRPCQPAPTVTEVAQSERPPSCPGSPQVTPLSPLIPPTTLIIGDSITRNIHFFNAITRWLPSATVPVIRDEHLNLLDSLPTSIKRTVVHVGTNDTVPSGV